jgi:hypothetical protein
VLVVITLAILVLLIMLVAVAVVPLQEAVQQLLLLVEVMVVTV